MVALAFGRDGQRTAPATRPPNIVFILADDLGFADVACYGRPDLRTPNIDHLAAQGVRFLQAYANSAVCTATRTALITGRYQYRLRLGLEEPLVGNKDVGLEPSHPTLPSLLKKARVANPVTARRAGGSWFGMHDTRLPLEERARLWTSSPSSGPSTAGSSRPS